MLLSCGEQTIPEYQFTEDIIIEIQQLFDDERFPNVIVATDGTVFGIYFLREHAVRRLFVLFFKQLHN